MLFKQRANMCVAGRRRNCGVRYRMIEFDSAWSVHPPLHFCLLHETKVLICDAHEPEDGLIGRPLPTSGLKDTAKDTP